MKKILLLLVCFAGFGLAAGAQDRFGYINSQELISLMAERDSAIVKIQAYAKDLDETIQGMQDEYNTKITEYQRKQGEWAPVVRESKERDIQELVNRIQQFQQTAQQEMQQMQQMQMAPVVEKAQAAIEKVAKSNSLLVVFDEAAGAVIYLDKTRTVDLLPMAKKELGIPVEKVAPTQFQQQQ